MLSIVRLKKVFCTTKTQPTEFYETDRVEELMNDGSTAIVVAFNPNKGSNKERVSKIIQAVAKFNTSSQRKVELFAGNALVDYGLFEQAKKEQVSIIRVSPWERELSKDNNVSPNIRQRNDAFLSSNTEVFGTPDA